MNKLQTLMQPAPSSSQYHWSFIRIGLWVSLSVLVILILVGIWSYKQTNGIVRQSQEQAGNGLAVGLANAIEENIIVRNFAQIEVQLLQAMADEQVQSIIVADADGRIISEVRRNPKTSNPLVLFEDVGKRFPDPALPSDSATDTLQITKAIGAVTPVGWIMLKLNLKGSHALLNGIHVQLLLVIGLAALIMVLVVSFSLRNTYNKIKLKQDYIEDLNDSLLTAAFYDPLTKLPNRPLLRDRLQQALSLSARAHHVVAVCYVDLDGFKGINDAYGHDAGDQVLIEVAKRLSLSVRQHDTVARIGGDEFVLVINDLSAPIEIKPILDRLLLDVTQPIDIGRHMVTIGASMGVSVSHQHGINPSALINLADKAMYKAKNNGKNQWCFYDIIDEPAIA